MTKKRKSFLIVFSVLAAHKSLMLYLDWLDLKCFIPSEKLGLEAFRHFCLFPQARYDLIGLAVAVLALLCLALIKQGSARARKGGTSIESGDAFHNGQRKSEPGIVGNSVQGPDERGELL